ncbi:mycothiol synthase [Ilumatobacter nonamiensis]|uniref:mycothiol synthase n=1 Tax=Ilumatobacter nonamiensis TaxID=467093 RepID=UPI000347A517|nr:mycothiol synthase [Ilumatobacter nonamiensis]
MTQLEVKRTMRGAEIAEVTALLDTAAAADGRPALSDHLELDLRSGGSSDFAGFVVRSPELDLPAAYAQLSAGNDNRSFEMVVHPEQRDHTATIGSELLEAALDVVGAEGGGAVNWWIHEPTPVDRELADAAGMTQDRTLFQMRRPLPTERHATIPTRAFVPGHDDEAWIAVNNRAFAGHAEQGGWTLDTLRKRQQEEWFDPEGFRIHERDDRIAGFCWTKVHHDAPDGILGEIYVIAVDPDFHGKGLGSEMTLAGLDHLAAQGITTALLYVDAANEGAVGMYRHLGFEVHSTNAAFVIEVGDRPDHEGLEGC